MARTVITPTAIKKVIKKGDTVSGITATTIDSTLVTAGVAVDIDVQNDSKVLVKIINTYAGTQTITIRSILGDNDDFTVDLAQNAVAMFTFETDRFEYMEEGGADDATGDAIKGKILIDFETATTGTIEVYSIAK